MDSSLKETLIAWAEEYNDPKYFQEDPIAFPRIFVDRHATGDASLAVVEISGLLAAMGKRQFLPKETLLRPCRNVKQWNF